MLTTNNMSDYPILLKIISKRNYPGQYRNYLVVHLRLGDVIDNSTHSVDEFLFKPIKLYHPNGNSVGYVKPLRYYEETINKIKNLGISKVIFITGFHRGRDHTKSLKYLSHVKNLFESKGFECQTRINLDPDEDFLIMCNAKYFVPSGGGFSDVITNIVKLKGGIVIPSSSQSLLSIQSKSINQRRKSLSALPKSTDSNFRKNSFMDSNVEKKKKDINQSDKYNFTDSWVND
jgi:hypothetical protein